jgi:V8-like Glu-specific endopeptidase
MKSMLIAGLALISVTAQGRSLCGEDRREAANEPTVGRVFQSGENGFVCTVTTIGRACAITAGHCTKGLQSVAFNTKFFVFGESARTIIHPRDIYQVDQKSIVQGTGLGNDYAVVRFHRHQETGLLPGEVQGFMPVALDYNPWQWEHVTITGHGVQQTRAGEAYPQKQHRGQIVKISGTVLQHRVDTTRGDSGAAMVASSGEIIGIHTNGGCGQRNGTNKGVLISKHRQLRAAIASCLDWEKGNL